MQAVETMPLRVELRESQAYVSLQPASIPNDHLFVVDIYSAESTQHPEFHLGWWAWPAADASAAQGIRFVYRSSHDVAAYLVCAEGEQAAQERWLNPDDRLAPLQHMNLLWYDEQHNHRVQGQVTLTITDEHLLQAYYANNAQRYALVNPYLQAFHQRRLEVLDRLFRRYIPPSGGYSTSAPAIACFISSMEIARRIG
jgi:hypothetical protein